MVMNKKGQAVMVGIMIAIMVFIVAVVFIEPLQDVIVLGRDATHLDCTNTSISTGQKGTCILVDLYLPYFFGACIFGGVAYILMRKLVLKSNE